MLRCLLLACLLLAACESRGPAERAGAAIDRAGSRTGEAVGGAAERTGNWVRDRTR